MNDNETRTLTARVPSSWWEAFNNLAEAEGISISSKLSKLISKCLEESGGKTGMEVDYDQLAAAVLRAQNDINPRHTKEEWLDHLRYDDCERCRDKVIEILKLDSESAINKLCPLCGHKEKPKPKGEKGFFTGQFFGRDEDGYPLEEEEEEPEEKSFFSAFNRNEDEEED